MKRENCRLIVFGKAPVPGQVKTRLLASMDALTVTRLYERLVLHCLSTAVIANVGPVSLWYTPPRGHPFFDRCAEEFGVELYAQAEGDLGRRMGDAFDQTLKRSACALLVGCDCPSLSCSDLKEAATILGEGADAVMGPAEDGGYVLLGLHRYRPELFTRISWGTDSVLRETRSRLHEMGWRWHELSKRWDVDHPGDVKRLLLEGYGDLIPFPAADMQKGELGKGSA